MHKDIIKNAKRLINLDTSVSGNGMPQAEKLVLSQLTGYTYKKYTNSNVNSYLFSNRKDFSNKFRILLNCHLDVVPSSNGEYKAVIKGDKLLGRGAIDMKSAASVIIHTYKEVASKVNYSLGLQITTDEEQGGYNGALVQVKNGLRADLVISGEQTDLNIKNETKGIIWVKAVFKGTSWHAAYPWDGNNALEEAIEFANKVKLKYPNPQSDRWLTTSNVAKINTTNTAYNTIPDNCEVNIDIRPVKKDIDEVIPFIKSILPKNARVEFPLNDPFQYTSKNNPLLVALQSTIESTTKNKCSVYKSNGSSDLRLFEDMNTIEFGPIGGGSHNTREWVSVKSLEQYYKILKEFLLSQNIK